MTRSRFRLRASERFPPGASGNPSQRTMVLLAEAKRMMELDAASREEQAEVELESERQRTQEAAPWGVGPNFCMVCGSIGADMTTCLRCAALEEAEAQRTQEDADTYLVDAYPHSDDMEVMP